MVVLRRILNSSWFNAIRLDLDLWIFTLVYYICSVRSVLHCQVALPWSIANLLTYDRLSSFNAWSGAWASLSMTGRFLRGRFWHPISQTCRVVVINASLTIKSAEFEILAAILPGPVRILWMNRDQRMDCSVSWTLLKLGSFFIRHVTSRHGSEWQWISNSIAILVKHSALSLQSFKQTLAPDSSVVRAPEKLRHLGGIEIHEVLIVESFELRVSWLANQVLLGIGHVVSEQLVGQHLVRTWTVHPAEHDLLLSLASRFLKLAWQI